MLINDQNAPDSRTAAAPHKLTGLAIVLLTLLFCGVVFLRHDFWNWHNAKPLLFGFLPVGLWWQGLVSILASVMLWLLVKFAWPGHLEHVQDERQPNPNAQAPNLKQ